MARRVVLIAIAACASGRNEPAPAIDAATQQPMVDAPVSTGTDASTDAPPSMATCTMPFTGVLATWSFAAESGSQTMTPVTSKAPGITAGAITRAAGLTAVSGAGSINSSSWPTSAQRDLTKYYTVSITPPSGCKLSIASIGTDARASGTGPVSAAISTSADTYGQTSPMATTAAATVPVVVTDATGAVEVRIYGYAASAAGGTMRLQSTLTITGSLQ